MDEKKTTPISVPEPECPLVMRLNAAKRETTSAINDILKKHNLPCFLYESILAEAYRQVLEGAKNESTQAYVSYEKQMQEWEKIQSKKDNKGD